MRHPNTMNASALISPLGLMYLLSVAVAALSYLCSRGPDGNLVLFYVGFAAVAGVYGALAWASRNDPIWPHLLGHLVLFLAAAAIGMWPRPRLDGMAGMLYLFVPAATVGAILVGAAVRLIARVW